MEQIRRQLPEWNVSLMAQRAGVAALGERGYLKETVNVVERERRFLTGALRDWRNEGVSFRDKFPDALHEKKAV